MSIVRVSRRGRGRRAVAALEVAMILPVLVTIVLGCVDFGRFCYAYISVTNAAREGAYYASFHPPKTAEGGPAEWNAYIAEAAKAEIGGRLDESKLGFPGAVVIDESDGLKRVRVEVQYTFETLVAWPFLPNTVVLSRAVEMRVLRWA
jgi:hypothetical protein